MPSLNTPVKTPSSGMDAGEPRHTNSRALRRGRGRKEGSECEERRTAAADGASGRVCGGRCYLRWARWECS